MTKKASCEWCDAEGWSYYVRLDNITGQYLCGSCRGRDRKCFACRHIGHEIVDGDVFCLDHAISYKQKRAQAIRNEFCELIGINVRNQKLERELVGAKKRYGGEG